MKNGTFVRIENGEVVERNNARLVQEVEENGQIVRYFHWKENYNLNGDFSTELMRFTFDQATKTWKEDYNDKENRNAYREANGLVPNAA